jgi:hypothetical protein
VSSGVQTSVARRLSVYYTLRERAASEREKREREFIRSDTFMTGSRERGGGGKGEREILFGNGNLCESL